MDFDDNAKRLPYRAAAAPPRYTTEFRRPADPSGRRLPWRSFIELPIVVWW
jgi:hypothetical protein